MIKLISAIVLLAGLVSCQEDGGYGPGPATAPVVQPVATYDRNRPFNYRNPGAYNNRNYVDNRNYAGAGFRPNSADFRYASIQNLRSENVNNGDGTFSYFYENDDGTTAQQRGFLKAPRTADEDAIQVQEGFYQYYAPDGQLIRVDYIADENGFQPKGEHLPTPPPIPEAIQKSLDLIYAGIEKQRQTGTTPRPYYQPQAQRYNPQENYNRYRPRQNAGGY